MNDTTKYAIGAGVGLFLWSKLRGIILFGWFLFLVFIVWAVATGSFSDSSKEVVSEKLDWESEQRIKENEILQWAKTVDLTTAAFASIKLVSRPDSPDYIPDWKEQVLKSERLAKCREAVHNNSPKDAYEWCKYYYDENHED